MTAATHTTAACHAERQTNDGGQDPAKADRGLPVANTDLLATRATNAGGPLPAQTSLSPQSEPRVMDPASLPDHFERLFRAAYGLCGRREDAEDLVQETYARVLRRPRMLRRDDDIVYLLRVLRNTWISNYRATSARPVTSDLAEVEFVADPREDPAIAAVELKAIYAAMRDLPDALRETVVAVDVAGLSYRQAARALGTRQGTIMSRLYRARERIVSQLDPPS